MTVRRFTPDLAAAGQLIPNGHIIAYSGDSVHRIEQNLMEGTIVFMKKLAVLLVGIYIVCMLGGCGMQSNETIKLRDLDFTILSEDKISDELKIIIEERKMEPFQLTYSDTEYMFICIGYGEQATGGYSITVNELYLTDNAVYVSTSLLGPDASEKTNQTPSYPFIVIKTEYLDQTVIFE